MKSGILRIVSGLITLVVTLSITGIIFQDDLVFWYAETRETQEAYRTYVELYPNGKHAIKADWKIQSMEYPGSYSIGIYTGTSPFDLSPHGGQAVLQAKDVADVKATLVADPFMIRHEGKWNMFFEVENEADHQGDIGYATSANGFNWTYGKIVLDESFHLSYPYVFEHDGDYYMIPESNAVSSVRLYRASKFPEEWHFEKTLLEGERFSDNSIVRYNQRWWLFSETSSHPHDNGTLRLYYADNLTGPWREHSKSPLIEGNPNIARPGGRVTMFNGDIYRFTQDCDPIYGYQVWVFKITSLTKQDYSEVLHRNTPIIKASGSGWNRLGMHHIDPHMLEDGTWLVSVDGLGDKQ